MNWKCDVLNSVLSLVDETQELYDLAKDSEDSELEHTARKDLVTAQESLRSLFCTRLNKYCRVLETYGFIIEILCMLSFLVFMYFRYYVLAGLIVLGFAFGHILVNKLFDTYILNFASKCKQTYDLSMDILDTDYRPSCTFKNKLMDRYKSDRLLDGAKKQLHKINTSKEEETSTDGLESKYATIMIKNINELQKVLNYKSKTLRKVSLEEFRKGTGLEDNTWDEICYCLDVLKSLVYEKPYIADRIKMSFNVYIKECILILKSETKDERFVDVGLEYKKYLVSLIQGILSSDETDNDVNIHVLLQALKEENATMH